MSVSLSAMFWRFDAMSVSLTCTREVSRITSSSMRTTSGAWLSRSKPPPFTPVSGSTVSSSMNSRTGLQRCRLNVLRDYQRAGVSTYSNISGTLECQSDAIHIDLHAVIEVNAGRHLVGAIKA